MFSLSFYSLLALSAVVTIVLAQGQTPPAGSPACEAALILANGININIMDQKQEQQALAAVDTALKQTPVDMNQFNAAKATLLTFVNNGIAIREMNQQITPLGNAATGGLAKVANAQLEELGLTMSLTGNPQQDAPTVATLQKDFAGGVMQNMQNMMDVSEL
ncbi:uncharacterized protein BCR38DRAFT_342033 [Pseudomassariella vexata]|uniref:Hydrophobic surface binding protein A-domain-containing protein n=1 Tax=Pseudomassariella vexata TaxID=1141098 RepID=A0A1Y2E014_9PEZI|nr:uncharacterized protein BCR38DRAFT_342033 [Pseudomassariella vexata]ORY64819.1 hypothetical protein BCR38DRAFT_342033 [Pseudomassariella vexata]